MFGIDFSEMLIIAVVALVVIGPRRLPRVARTLGHLVGRMQRYVNQVKADINREMELEELRKFKREFEDAAQSVQNSIKDGVEHARSEFDQAKTEMRAVAESLRDELSSPAISPPATSPASAPAVTAPADSSPADSSPALSPSVEHPQPQMTRNADSTFGATTMTPEPVTHVENTVEPALESHAADHSISGKRPPGAA